MKIIYGGERKQLQQNKIKSQQMKNIYSEGRGRGRESGRREKKI